MSKFAIDTSAWVEYFSNPSEKLKKIIDEEKIVTSAIAIAELSDKFLRENLSFQRVFAFIQSKANIIDFDSSLAIESSKIKYQYRKKRNKFGLADAIHLATAQLENATFITKDKDFLGIKGVEIIN